MIFIDISEFLKDFRQKLELSMEDVASATGISKGTISNIENKKTKNSSFNIYVSLLRYYYAYSDWESKSNVSIDDMIAHDLRRLAFKGSETLGKPTYSTVSPTSDIVSYNQVLSNINPLKTFELDTLLLPSELKRTEYKYNNKLLSNKDRKMVKNMLEFIKIYLDDNY